MPTFEIDDGQKTYEVDAPDAATAARSSKIYLAQQKIRARMPGSSPFANKTVSNIASEAMGAVDPLLGLNSLLDKGVYGAGQLITSAGGLAPNPVSRWMGEAAHSGEKISDMADKALQAQRASSGQSGFDPFRLAGNIASPVNAVLPAPTGLVDAAGMGASYGAMQPTHEGDTPLANVANAAMGAGGGMAGYGITKGVNRLLWTAPAAPPSTAQLKAGAGYKDFAAKSVTMTPEASAALNGNPGKTAIQHAMTEAEINQEGHLVNEFKGLLELPSTEGITLSTEAADKLGQSFDTLARAAGKDSPNAARGWASRSDAMETAIQQTPEINDARNVWAQFRKSETIDKTIKRAIDKPGTPAGFGDSAQALRKSFGQLVISQKFQSFNDEEQKAIKDVANGTLTANTLQRLGKFSPVKGHLSGLLEIGLGAGGDVLAGGMTGALPAIGLATVGEAARQGSNYATSRAANMASELVRRGGPAAARTLSPRAAALAQMLQQPTAALGRIPPAVLAQMLQTGSAGAPVAGQ